MFQNVSLTQLSLTLILDHFGFQMFGFGCSTSKTLANAPKCGSLVVVLSVSDKAYSSHGHGHVCSNPHVCFYLLSSAHVGSFLQRCSVVGSGSGGWAWHLEETAVEKLGRVMALENSLSRATL